MLSYHKVESGSMPIGTYLHGLYLRCNIREYKDRFLDKGRQKHFRILMHKAIGTSMYHLHKY
ncbi:hypothetical protein IX326_001902 [Porphyromonas levii]|nr:hypothetical protein [Porphyromonas levii]